MKKTLAIVVVAAISGAVLMTAMQTIVMGPAVVAQDTTVGGQLRSPSNTGSNRGSISDASLNDFTPEERVNIAVYEQTNQSVVNITTTMVRGDAFFFGEVPSEGSGSGSVLDRRGHILTNYHVIEGAREADVRLFNGDSYSASLVGADPNNDIAVLKIDAPEDVLYPVLLGDSTGLCVGQKAYAIGNPFGLERTLTVGVISSLNRQLDSPNQRTMKSIIQIDAALNRGNSGGPLMNSRGKLIGMNTAIASRVKENSGVGFAVPVNTIRRVVPQLLQHGRVIRPTIGITRDYESEEGLTIVSTAEDGPADKAGLRGFRLVREERRVGGFIQIRTRVDPSYADTITAIDGKRVQTTDDLQTIIESKKPGDTVTVTVIRDGKKMNVRVVLADERG